MLVAGDFPAILGTTDQTFFIEVRLLILETYVCQECRLDVLITRLVLANFQYFVRVGCFCTRFRALFRVLIADLQSLLHQMVLCFLVFGLLLGMLLFAILMRTSVNS